MHTLTAIRRLAAVALGAGLVAGALVAPVTATADTELPNACGRATNGAGKYDADISKVADAGVVTWGGESIVVTGPSAEYDFNDPKKISSTLWFRSLVWLVPLAKSGQSALANQIALDWAAAVPDPGHTASGAELRATGWTEGAITHRLDVATCLYAISGDARLRGLATSLAKANMDPYRYRGLPYNDPHNHGAMANRALLEAADIFNRPSWRDTAISRVTTDFDEVFSACGMHNEQASTYLMHNHKLWTLMAGVVEDAGRKAKAASMRATLRTVWLTAAQLTYPDGIMPMIGDAYEMRGVKAPTKGSTQLWCSDQGWAANRTSWRNPDVHYTLRFGPSPRFHGHNDHGSLTWWTDVAGGAVAIEDPGTPHRDLGVAETDLASGLSMHNVFEPVGIDYSPRTEAERVRSGSVDEYVLTDRSLRLGIQRERTVDFAMDKPVLVVEDQAKSKTRTTWRQHWHLGEGWEPVTGSGTAVARHANGSTLHIICKVDDGRWNTAKVVASTRYPDWGSVDKSWDARCTTTGSKVDVTTVLAVTKGRGNISVSGSGDVTVDSVRLP